MKREELKEQLLTMISNVTGNGQFKGNFNRLRPEEIQETYLLGDDLGLDSLDLVEVILKVEENFGLSIPDEDMTNIKERTVGGLIDYVYSKVAGRE